MALSEQQQIKMCGETFESIRSDYNEAMSKQIFLMGILSDAQEELARGNAETARQLMNKAKYIISYLPRDTFIKPLDT